MMAAMATSIPVEHIDAALDLVDVMPDRRAVRMLEPTANTWRPKVVRLDTT